MRSMTTRSVDISRRRTRISIRSHIIISNNSISIRKCIIIIISSSRNRSHNRSRSIIIIISS